jgi:hypothetical protein
MGLCNFFVIFHLISRDATLNECADFKNNFEAERSGIGHVWVRTEIDENKC